MSGGAGPPAHRGGPRRLPRSSVAAAPSSRTVPGAELGLAWARGEREPGGGGGACGAASGPVSRQRIEPIGNGGGHSPPGVTHRRRSGRAVWWGESPGWAGPLEQRGGGFPAHRALWGGRAGAGCDGSRALVIPVWEEERPSLVAKGTEQAREELLEPGTERESSGAGLQQPAVRGRAGPQAPAEGGRAAAWPPPLATTFGHPWLKTAYEARLVLVRLQTACALNAETHAEITISKVKPKKGRLPGGGAVGQGQLSQSSVCPRRGGGARGGRGGWREPRSGLSGTLGAPCQIRQVLVQKWLAKSDAVRQPIVCHQGRIRMFATCLFPFLVQHLREEGGRDETKLP